MGDVLRRGIRARCTRCHRRHRGARQAADPGRRHRAVFPRAAARSRADAGRGPRIARGTGGRGRADRLACDACATGAGRPRRRAPHPRHRPATHPARAGSVSRERSHDHRLAARPGARPPAGARAETRARAEGPRGAARTHRATVRRDARRRIPRRGACAARTPAIRAVGYRQAWEFLSGQGDADAFRERAIAATRQLAKRQWTWLRGEADALWCDPATDARRMERLVAGFLGSGFAGLRGTPVTRAGRPAACRMARSPPRGVAGRAMPRWKRRGNDNNKLGKHPCPRANPCRIRS